MTCPNCHEPTEEGAYFCGNCGFALVSASSLINGTPSVPSGTMPSYAVTRPGQHQGETKALLALLFGIAGIVGALFMAIVGLVLGVAGVVMGTMSRSTPKRGLSTAGLIVSGMAIAGSLAVWAYAISNNPQFKNEPPAVSSGTNITSASNLNTPCYATGFVDVLNISNDGSCDMSAFNGQTLNRSTNLYKIYASKAPTANAMNFTAVAKASLEKDIRVNLPGFSVQGRQNSWFAGSKAYIIWAHNSAQNVSVVEGAVLHPVTDGENVFVLVHAANGGKVNLDTLEAQWQWK